MLLLAAGWGSKPAQHMLGLAYLNGAGLTKDRPLGLAWLRLAAERKDPDYLGIARAAYGHASAEERAKADALHDQLRERYRDDIAAARAKRRFDREIRALTGNPVYNPGICLIGINSQYTQNIDPTDGGAGPSCPPADKVAGVLEELAEPYFEGWQGRVDVGPPEQVEGSKMQPRPEKKISP